MVSKTQDEQGRLTGDQKALPSIEAQLNRLDRISVRLRSFGLMVFIFTAANFMSLILSIFPLFSSRVYILFLSLFFYLLTAIGSAMFDMRRKEGNALFEEISDEFQLREVTSSQDRPLFEVRIILRTFARASDLPLIPGDYGPILYVMMNLMLLLIQVWLYRYPSL